MEHFVDTKIRENNQLNNVVENKLQFDINSS